MKKNDTTVTNDNAKKLAKQKAREAAKAKRVKLLEKRKAQVAANKAKRAAKKAKRLAKLEKERAKKAALREKKRVARQKKLERIAKQRAKAKELKAKARAKAKLLKEKEAAKLAKQKKDNSNNVAATTPVDPKTDTIDITVKLLKDYLKQLAKDADIDDKKIKKLSKLGFVFNDDTIGFTIDVKRKAKKQVAKQPETVDEPVVDVKTPDEPIEVDAEIVTTPDEDKLMTSNVLADDEAAAIEVPVGDTFDDNVNTSLVDDQPNGFEDDEIDDTIEDSRDEVDDDKVDFRRDWNNEYDDNGERIDD